MNRVGKWIGGAVFFIGWLAAWLTLRAYFSGDIGILIVVAAIPVLSFVATLVHELGHAAAVIAVKGHIREIVVLPFIYRPGSRWAGVTDWPKDCEYGGYVAYDPGTLGNHRKTAIVAIAGPMANFLLIIATTLIAYLLANLVAGGGVQHDTASVVNIGKGLLPSDSDVLKELAYKRHLHDLELVRAVMLALGYLSAGAGLANLVPFNGSDGAVIMRALFPLSRRTHG
ncbi:MAG: site-2 protease family protein [Pseudomonadota bacterium]|uniref:site-2 protease family protein n=1 Tax=Sphingomonas sp. ERG5 TaxID=1381597 RepID=UPI00054BADE7|nr:site-2 protease family protein [Sphingomonas sp. ERG5]